MVIVNSEKSGPISSLSIRMDFLIHLIKDCEDKPKEERGKRKEREKFKENLINDCILK